MSKDNQDSDIYTKQSRLKKKKKKTEARDKEGHFIIIKETIQQEDIPVVNIYAPNVGAPKYIKQLIT